MMKYLKINCKRIIRSILFDHIYVVYYILVFLF